MQPPFRPTLQRRALSVGFTLVEVLAATTVMLILASVALPAYSDYARRGQLPEAFGGLADYRARMEQYFQDNNSYGAAACADDASASSWNRFEPQGGKSFRFDCAMRNDRQGYVLTATGVSGAAAGHVYTLDHNAERRTTRFKGESVVASCWLTKNSVC